MSSEPGINQTSNKGSPLSKYPFLLIATPTDIFESRARPARRQAGADIHPGATFRPAPNQECTAAPPPFLQLHQPSRELLVLTLLKWDTLGPDTDPSLSGPVATGAVAAAAAAGPVSARVLSRGGRGSDAKCRGDNPGPGAGFQSGAADVRQRIPIGFHPGGDVPGGIEE